MMKPIPKRDFPLTEIRRYLEPGPIVLVSPALVACYIWDQNHSYEMIRRSRECVINVPTVDLARQTVDIGNCRGTRIDKFTKFGPTPEIATEVSAPLIGECYANFECKLHRLVTKDGLFIWEVVKAHVAPRPKYPETIHYRGDGIFMVSGRTLNLRKRFKPQNL